MVYNFVLIMCNTGMRPPEAKNLRWRDVTISMVRKDTRGRESLTDRTFGASPRKGKQAKTLYSSLVHDLLEESGLLIGLAGTARSKRIVSATPTPRCA